MKVIGFLGVGVGVVDLDLQFLINQSSSNFYLDLCKHFLEDDR
jgi:hypothetical protein